MRDLSMNVLEANRSALSETEYRRARHAVSEIARVLDAVGLLKKQEFVEFGKLLNQSHLSLRDDYNVSCPELDLAVETANSLGALLPVSMKLR